MYTALAEQTARALVHDRQLQAVERTRARRLLTARRWQRRAEEADRRARLARLALD